VLNGPEKGIENPEWDGGCEDRKTQQAINSGVQKTTSVEKYADVVADCDQISESKEH